MEAAVGLADTNGLDAVSMNTLGAELGVTAMALYRHVSGKAELVDLMVESVLTTPPDLPGTSLVWRSGITEWARQLLAIFQAHPWLLAATVRGRPMGPAQLTWLDAILAVLETSPLAVSQRHHTFLLIVGFVRNLAQQRIDFAHDYQREWHRQTSEFLHLHRFPALVRAIDQGLFERSDDDPLTSGLELILDGVETLVRRSENPSA